MREASEFEAWYSLRNIEWGPHNDLRQACAENPVCADLAANLDNHGSTSVSITKNTRHTDEPGWTDCAVTIQFGSHSSCSVSINEGTYSAFEAEFGVLNNGIVLAHELGHVAANAYEYLNRGATAEDPMSNRWALYYENEARLAHNYRLYGSYADVMTPRRTYH